MILQAGNVLKGNSAGWAQHLCCATSRGAGWLTVRIRSRIFRTLIRPCCLFCMFTSSSFVASADFLFSSCPNWLLMSYFLLINKLWGSMVSAKYCLAPGGTSEEAAMTCVVYAGCTAVWSRKYTQFRACSVALTALIKWKPITTRYNLYTETQH